VACIYDPARGIKQGFNLILDGHEDRAAQFLSSLDEADSLCAFNGARFDLPFIIKRYGVPQARYRLWYMKLFDYFEVIDSFFVECFANSLKKSKLQICKVLLGSSCSLNNLLLANGRQVKTSSGMQAVVWAREVRSFSIPRKALTESFAGGGLGARGTFFLHSSQGADRVVCRRWSGRARYVLSPFLARR
jgi:hypothetical protein